MGRTASYKFIRALIPIFVISLFLSSSLPATALESDVDLANFSISIKGPKLLTKSSGKVTIKSVVNEPGRWCVFLYVLDIADEELEKLQEDPINNLMNHEGLDVFPNGAKVKGTKFSRICAMRNRRLPPRSFRGRRPSLSN